MDIKKMNEQAMKIRALEKESARITATIKSLQDDIKSAMEAADVDTVETELFTIRWKKFLTTSFDKKAFMKENADLYSRYTSKTMTQRFTIK